MLGVDVLLWVSLWLLCVASEGAMGVRLLPGVGVCLGGGGVDCWVMGGGVAWGEMSLGVAGN